MTIWCRIKQSQVKALSNQLKKTFSQVNAPCLINQSSPITRFCVVENQSLVFTKNPFQFGNNARFFAAPVQVKTRQESKDSDEGPRLNEEIKAPYIRLVTDEGHSVVTRYEALQRAKTLKLDLVEVDRSLKPPACKLMDYHKEKFQKELKEKERMKSKKSESLRMGTHKEVRISGKIEKKDLQMKADTVRRMTERGYRVKCMAVGKEDEDLGTLLSRLAALIEDFSIVESGPKVERRQAYVIVRHVKFGPSKKGKGKEKIIVPPSNFSSQSEDNMVEEDPGVENKDITLSESEEDLPTHEKNKSTWTVFDKTDGYDEVFEIGNNASKVTASKAQPAMENRYKRGPINGVPPTRQMNEDLRNSTGFEPRFQNQGGQRQFEPSTPPPPSPSFGLFNAQKVNNDPQRHGEPAEVNRYSSQRQNGPAEVNRYGSQRQNGPAEVNRYSSQRQNGPAEVNRYGSQRQNGPAEVNRYSSQRQNGPAEVNRYSRGPNPNAPPSTSHGKERPFYDKGGQGRPGMTPHSQGPNVNPRGNTDRQYDVRR